MKTITIDIISDVICPWCFIGKRRLERAMLAFEQQAQFRVRWHPFYLSPPDMPLQSKLLRYKAKFGGERVAQMVPMMAAVGAREGIAFDYGGPIAGTVLPHRAIEYAELQEPAQVDAVVETLFRAYFERQGNVFEREAIVGLMRAEAVEIDLERLDAWLADEQGQREMNARVEQQDEGVTGVPFFTIDGKYKFSGAQEPEVFQKIFKQLI